MARVLVVGSINMDLIVRCDRIPQEGETIHGEDLVTAGGGKGANQAVAASRLGAHTTLIGRVGRTSSGPGSARHFRRTELIPVSSPRTRRRPPVRRSSCWRRTGGTGSSS
jgi:ribokinase